MPFEWEENNGSLNKRVKNRGGRGGCGNRENRKGQEGCEGRRNRGSNKIVGGGNENIVEERAGISTRKVRKIISIRDIKPSIIETKILINF